MTIPIQSIRPISTIELPQMPAVGGTSAPAGAFQAALETAMDKVQQTRSASEDVVNRFLNGENEDIHNVVLATQKTELQFEMFLQVRNKFVQAYQEVMRMQL